MEIALKEEILLWRTQNTRERHRHSGEAGFPTQLPLTALGDPATVPASRRALLPPGKRRAAAATRSGTAIAVLAPRPICRGELRGRSTGAVQPRPAAPQPDQGKTGSRVGARHRGRSPRTAQRGPVLPPPHARPHGCVRPDTCRGQPRLLSPAWAPGHRRDGADTLGVQRGVPGPLLVVSRPSWGPHLSSSMPRISPLLAWSSRPRRYRRGTASALLSPQMEPRWLEAASARSQLRGQGCLPPSLLPSLHLSLPISLGPQPSLSALTSSQDGCPGPVAVA